MAITFTARRWITLVLCGTLASGALAALPENTYTAATTYKKLIGKYPFIQIASAEPAQGVRAVRNLTYREAGGRALQLDLYLPAASARRAPAAAVVLVHGGGWRSGERNNLAPMAVRLAERGIAAATVSYRLADEAKYPAAIHDIKAAVRYVRANAAAYDIDPDRIAVAGGSAGGQIASLVGVTNGVARFDPDSGAGKVSSAAQAIINIDGLSDFTSEAARVNEDDPGKKPSAAGFWFDGRYAEKPALWREASPTFYVSAATPPILFIGSAQERFSVGREDMIAKLTTAGVASKVVLLPNTPHSFWLFDPWLTPTVDAMADFLKTALPSIASKGINTSGNNASRTNASWSADLGNGNYQNPILHADYSDPDAIRVGDSYYMTSSSFSNTPGLPLLTSKDMVNWELVGHALPRLVPEQVFATPQPGKGVWAPSLRFHDGKFWIFYPDPDFGIYVITAERFEGPWTAPHLLLPGKGIIDPAPLWDEDGKAYLVHGWARSRAGINNLLSLRSMAPDGKRLLDSGPGKTIIDGNKLPGYRTLEGPKIYKEKGYYYVFAPAGGVEEGWQSVFRARSIEGPYEDKIVMAQKNSPTNGPHQGAWVRAQDGSDWFFHFQDKRAYGRVVHLQPMRWKDGWPLIGQEVDDSGIGQPFVQHAKPLPGISKAPPSGDEFAAPTLGYQWQWSANSEPRWYSLSARPGHLRLFAQSGSNLREMASVLTQKPPAPAFTVDTRIELGAGKAGDRAGLVLLGMKYAALGLRRAAAGNELVLAICEGDALRCSEKDQAVLPYAGQAVYLRMTMAAGVANFAYSSDGVAYTSVGAPFTASMGRWVGAQMGLYSSGGDPAAFADVDYFRVSK